MEALYWTGRSMAARRKEGKMTTAEYLATEETVLPRELAYGELRVADSPIVVHQRAVVELTVSLAPFVRERRLGELLVAPMDVILDAQAALVVQPDLLFISEARRSIVSDKVYGAPDLVIEVLSPHPRIGRLDERVGWFARYGVQECWLANVFEKTIVVLTLGTEGVAETQSFSGAAAVESRVLGGLQLSPLQIFGL